MRRVDEQLRKLGTAARATMTDLKGGRIRFLPKSGADHPRVTVGAGNGDDAGISMTDEDGEAYFEVGASTGRGLMRYKNPDNSGDVLLISDGKVFGPLISCAWQFDPLGADWHAEGYAEVTGGTYSRCWSSFLPITSGAIISSIVVTLTGTAVVDVRIRARDYSAAGPPVTVAEQTGISGAVWLSGSPWSVPSSFSGGDSPVGRLALLEIEARVASGTGTALVAPDAPVVNWVG